MNFRKNQTCKWNDIQTSLAAVDSLVCFLFHHKETHLKDN